MKVPILRDEFKIRGPHPQAVELTEKRDAQSKHFRNPDGSITAIFCRGMHFRAVDGSWRETDLSFRRVGVEYICDQHLVRTQVRGSTVTITDPVADKGIRWVLPGLPSVTSETVRHNEHGLSWEHRLSGSGIKVEASVDVPRGPRTYTFKFALINSDLLTEDNLSGDLVGEGFRVRRSFVRTAKGQWHICGPWRIVSSNQISFDWDDSVLSIDAYPYVIDPTTTFTVATGTDDGDVSKVSGAWPPGGSATAATNNYFFVQKTYAGGPTYTLRVGLARFDTSSIIAGTVSSGVFSEQSAGTNLDDGESHSFYLEYYSTSNWPIDAADYTATPSSSAGSLALTYANFINTVYHDVTLGSLSNINLKGYTGFRGHFNDWGAPAGHNYVALWDYDNGNSSNWLKLTLTYTNTAPNTPTGTFPSGTVAGNVDLIVEGTDPDTGDTLQFEWSYSDDGGGSWSVIPGANLTPTGNPTAAIAQATPQTVAWNTTTVADDTDYRMRVRAYDGAAYGAYHTQGVNFTIDNNVALTVSDTGSGSDSISALSAVLATLSDTGSGVDALAEMLAAFTASDTGSGVDALTELLASFLLSDVGVGSDSYEAGPLLLDSGAGVDSLIAPTVSFTASDTGTGADIVAALASIMTLADSGVGTDTVAALEAVLAVLSDVGVGVDAAPVVAVAFTLSDSGTIGIEFPRVRNWVSKVSAPLDAEDSINAPLDAEDSSDSEVPSI